MDQVSITTPTVGANYTHFLAIYDLDSESGMITLSDSRDSRDIVIDSAGWERLLRCIDSDGGWTEHFSGLDLSNMGGSISEKIDRVWNAFDK